MLASRRLPSIGTKDQSATAETEFVTRQADWVVPAVLRPAPLRQYDAYLVGPLAS